MKRIEISGFQSLHKIDLELGKLTVIVGPSSSGKTALVRALKVLVNNSRGAGYISHGAKSARVAVELDGATLAIERSASSGAYEVVRTGQEVERHTKLGGAVPAAVQRLLGIGPEGLAPELCFAGQFDKPYLLDETGAKVAQVLGELTNVSVIFEASKEANRRRLASNAELRLRESDLAGLYRQMQSFQELPAKLASLAEAETVVKQAQELESKASRLRSLVDAIEISESALATLAPTLTVPDYAPIETAYSRLARYKEIIREIIKSKLDVDFSAENIDLYSKEFELAEHELHDKLVEAGTCPMCGQGTKDIM